MSSDSPIFCFEKTMYCSRAASSPQDWTGAMQGSTLHVPRCPRPHSSDGFRHRSCVRRPAMSHTTVLVIDDSPDIRVLVRRALAPDGYTIVESANGLDAIRLARQCRPALIL